MPELPEVETTCRGISEFLISKVIYGGIVHEHRLRYKIQKNLIQKLTGQTLLKISRRGKYIIMSFAKGSLIIHLGMSGSLRILGVKHKKRKHDHVEIFFDNLILRYHDPRRFGALIWTENDPAKHTVLKDLGPEPLESGFDGKYLYRQTRRRKCAVKNLIMNNHIVVGVGNIYANEALHAAGIHPGRVASKISEKRYELLAKEIKVVLSNSIKAGGTTLRDFYSNDGKPGYFKTKLKVYGRTGLLCESCSRTIRHTIIGQRSTYYCTHCQK